MPISGLSTQTTPNQHRVLPLDSTHTFLSFGSTELVRLPSFISPTSSHSWQLISALHHTTNAIALLLFLLIYSIPQKANVNNVTTKLYDDELYEERKSLWNAKWGSSWFEGISVISEYFIPYGAYIPTHYHELYGYFKIFSPLVIKCVCLCKNSENIKVTI